MKRLIPALLLLLTFTACQENINPPAGVDPAFSAYVSAFTSQVVSTEATIRVRLTDAFAGEIEPGSPAESSLLEINPGIEGQLFWVNDRTLEFRPSKPLPNNQAYNVKVKLGEITDVPQALEVFEFDFRTMKQFLTVDVASLRPYTNQELRWHQLRGMVTTRDAAQAHRVEQTVAVKQGTKPLTLSWTHEPGGLIHHFTADSVERTEKPQEIDVRWNGKAIDAEQEGQQVEELPALGDFRVVSPRVVQQPDQYVILRFSDPIASDQDLSSFIRVKGVRGNSTVRIVDNEVHLYPPRRLSGSQIVEINPGVKNILGYKLNETTEVSVTFEAVKPDIRFSGGNKTILPSTDGLLFPFEAVNLSAVDVKIIQVFESNIPQFLQNNHLDGNREMRRVGRVVRKKTVRLDPDGQRNLAEWNSFALDMEELISSDPGAIYRVELSFRPNHSIYPCPDLEQAEDADLTTTDEDWDSFDEEEFSYWNYYDDYYYDYYYDYDWRERENPCNQAYYRNRRAEGRNLLASDLGLIAKMGSTGEIQAFVTDLRSTAPLSGVEVEVFNFQQQSLGKAVTDGSGQVKISKIRQKPYLLVARQGDQRGYQRLDDGSSLSLSRFDVAGQTVEQGIKGFLYGERGVWRPGDTLFLNFMLEDPDRRMAEAGHPLRFELFDARGQLVERRNTLQHLDGLYSFTVPTSADAPTGNWRALVRAGGATFSKYLKVETVKPNRLKLAFNFDKDMLTREEEEFGAQLEARWLHGAPARRLRAKVSARFLPTTTRFDRFQEFCFDDPVRQFNSRERVLFDGRLSDEGLGTIPVNTEIDQQAPGMLTAWFETRVFEEGGDFSSDKFSIPYAPYETFVGLKLPKGDRSRGMLLTDKKHRVEVVTCNAEGKPVSAENLEYEVFEVQWRWWWEHGSENLASYISSQGITPLQKGTLNTDSKGSGSFEFEIEYPEWGRFLVRVVDPAGGHATGKMVYIDWPGWAGRAQRENPGGASMLVFSADKEKYDVGQTCTLTFPSGGNGRALVSIENGSEVLETAWIDCEPEQTQYSFQVTDEMAPNVYAHITLLQPHAQTANDLPIRLYGLLPVMVEDPRTHVKPEITMPEVLRPEKSFTVEVSERDGKEMTYTLAVVDEGLLDLTRFQTPDPWKHFFAREALGVRTWDLYDQVIGAQGAKMDRLLSLGGGGEGSDEGAAKAMRFKPVVMHMGPFHLKPGESASHELEMPNYVGSVRTMVVARNGEAYGKAEATRPVKNPLMVLATLPRVASPGEDVVLPVNVFAMENHVRDVEISVETNGLFEVQGASKRNMRFENIGDGVSYFKLKAAEKLGIAKVSILARSGKEVARYEVEMDLRNPNPEVTEVEATELASNGSASIPYQLVGMAGTNTAYAEISTIPPIDLTRRLRYLIGYPHGCLEQTTSRAFPQLYLPEVVDVPDQLKQDMHRYVDAAVKKIENMQHANGGLTYWPGNSNPNDWSTSYAGHFMLEARARGHAVDKQFLDNWIRYQRKTARDWRNTGSGSNPWQVSRTELTQAYRLFTLALANEPEMGAMNRLREVPGLSVQAKWRLAAAYFLSGQETVAREMIANLTTDTGKQESDPYTYGSSLRDRAMILEVLAIMGERTRGAASAKEIAAQLNSSRWHSTHTTSYSLMAMSRYADGQSAEGLRFTYAQNGAEPREVVSAKSMVVVPLDATGDLSQNLDLENRNEHVLFVRIIRSGQPVAGQDRADSRDLRIYVRYEDMQGQDLDVSKLEQGQDFKAVVTVSHPGVRDHYNDLAVQQIFPSGWEILNPRMSIPQASAGGLKPEYTDIRDDRVNQYFDLRRNKSLTYSVLLNASYQGRYYLPSVSAEAMYDNTIYARTAGKWIEVLPAGGVVAER